MTEKVPNIDAPPLPNRRIKGLGWKPDTPDQRDRKFNHLKVLKRLRQKLPTHVDLRGPNMPPLYDQGELGSCTANAIAAAYEFEQKKQGLQDYNPSRLFIYYAEREIEGSINDDSGAEIRDGLTVVNKLGAPNEGLWAYNIQLFTQRPPQAAYDDGLKHRALAYESVDVHTTAVKAALASGVAVIVGFTVYSSFFQIGSDGLMPIPKPNERVEGGHAVLVVGYKQMVGKDGKKRDHAIIRNSWGGSWADGGYFYMPLAWLCNRNNADDFWAIQAAEA